MVCEVLATKLVELYLSTKLAKVPDPKGELTQNSKHFNLYPSVPFCAVKFSLNYALINNN